MSQPNEPSMEEILSSIKRIIAEDSETLAPRRGAPAPAPDDEPDVLELTQPWGEPEEAPAPTPEPEPIAVEEAPALASAPVAPSPKPAAQPQAAEDEAQALLSATTEAATRHALASLSRLVVKPEDPAADNTLEGLVRDMLRPMLKDWLDAHLPDIVQATVDREVARISGRGQ